MGAKRLLDKVDRRNSESFVNRLLYCAGMLHIHGLLSDAERQKVHERMMRRVKREAHTTPGPHS